MSASGLVTYAGVVTLDMRTRRRRRHVMRAVVFGAAAAALVGAALLWYAASDDLPPSTPTALLDAIMPVYDVQEVHSTHVDAQPANVYAAIFAVTPGETTLARPFLWVRTLPGRLHGGRPIDDGIWSKPFLSMSDTAILGRVPDREIVVGLIGQFWKLRAGERVAVQSREQFMAFNGSGFAVSTLSFHVDPEGTGSRVTTITRVRTTDAESRRAFLRYWRVIGTGSALLRRTWLRAVKARAERSATT
jgi:hypothetical protein